MNTIKKITKMEPVNYILLYDKIEIKYEHIINIIDEMIRADWTEFNLNDKKDAAIYSLIKEICKNEEISHETYISKNKIRIHWDDNEKILTKLIDDLYDLVYK